MQGCETIAKSFKCGRKKATAVVEVVAQEVRQGILCCLTDSQFFSIQIDETTDITISQRCGVCNKLDKVG